MIRINLLQVHEVKRRLEARRQLQVACLLLVVAMGAGGWLSYQQQQVERTYRRELVLIEQELESLKEIIKEVQQFEKQKALLQRKLNAIKTIQANQGIPAPYLDELSRRLPEQVWLETLQEDGVVMTIKGKSLNGNPGVADFMKNIERSPLFGTAGLIESVAGMQQERRVISFTIAVPIIKLKQQPEKKEEATS